MYECNIISTEPGLNTASIQGAKPGFFGRPWQATTSEVVFYNTTIDRSTFTGFEGKSLIDPEGCNPDQADMNTNGIGDACEDSDGDGLMDSEDACPNSPEGVIVDVFGCEVFTLPADNYSIIANAVSCNGENNGSISISAGNTDYMYNVSVSGTSFNGATALSSTSGFFQIVEDLAGGIYKVCITIDGKDMYEQCFNVTIQGPTPLEAYSSTNQENNQLTLTISGATNYQIKHNGILTNTSKSTIVIHLVTGKNTIEVSTDSGCQGTYFEEIFVSENVVVYPNPTKGYLQVYVGGVDTKVEVSLFDLKGIQHRSLVKDVPMNRVIELDLTNLNTGIYSLLLNSDTIRQSIKIIKE